MIRKDQKPFSFTDWHVQQPRRSTHSLRKINRAALCELRRIGRTSLTHTQLREASKSIGIMASRMILLLRLREGILVAGREQQPQLIQIIFSSCCENCTERQSLRKPDCEETVGREALKNDPAYQKELESLLGLALRTEEKVSAQCELGRTLPSVFILKVCCLISAVIRQQQQLRDMAIRQEPKIEVCDYDCASCDSPMENE